MRTLSGMMRPATVVAAIALILAIRPALAVPELQLYIEGATYDSSTETWVADISSSGTLRLWAVGNVSGPGGKGELYGVKLSVAYQHGDTPTISLTSSTTGGYGGFTDPSTPGAATYIQTVTDGSVPLLGDGSPLPTHGEYGPGTDWMEFALGNFTLNDSPMGDFITSFPTPGLTGQGQINVYEIAVSGTDSVHFDLYDHYYSKTKASYKFAPFSHDGTGTSVPDNGSTIFLLGLAISGLAVVGWRRRRKTA